jgi:hypothetical protein
MAARGHVEFKQLGELQLQEAMPVRCTDFRFLEQPIAAGFYTGWQEDFSAVDRTRMYPFGVDSHYFYLIAENSADPTDPLVYRVDHETTHEEPTCPEHLTVGSLLSILATA